MMPAVRPARDIVVIGGGCYGTFYARQLERAWKSNKFRFRRVLVVDRDSACQATRELDASATLQLVREDWAAFLDTWLRDEACADDAIVPSPLMPHLMFDWLVRVAAHQCPGKVVRQLPVDTPGRTPFDQLSPAGSRFLSHADWLCPTHCIEPALCPAIAAPRTWDMAETVARLAERLDAVPVTFRCLHRAFGVGMYGVDEAITAQGVVEVAGARAGTQRVLVSTVSHCHGASGLLALEDRVREPADVSVVEGAEGASHTARSRTSEESDHRL